MPIPGRQAFGDLTPWQMPGVLLWYRADLGVTFNGGTVSNWADQSGGGHDASQSVAANGFGYTFNGGPGGTAAMIGNNTLATRMTNGFASTGKPLWIWIVCYWTTASTLGRYVLDGQIDNTMGFGRATNVTTLISDAVLVQATFGAATPQVPHAYGMNFSNVTANVSLDQDSTRFTGANGGISVGGTLTLPSITGMTIGSPGTTVSDASDCLLSEILIVNSSIAIPPPTVFDRYRKQRYGF